MLVKRRKDIEISNKFKSRVLSRSIKTCISYSGTKLSSRFQLKDHTKKDHQHDVVYYVKRPEEQYTEDYTGESGRRLMERGKGHSGKDLKSHLIKHSVETTHKMFTLDDFKIVGKGQNLDVN